MNTREPDPQSDQKRNLGQQPIAQIMAEFDLKAHDLVRGAAAPMTHKMVARACKGRRLTRHTQLRVLQALNAATGRPFTLRDLFTY